MVPRITTASVIALAVLACACTGCARNQSTWYEAVAQSTPPAVRGEDVADEVDRKVLPSRETAMRVLLRTDKFTDLAIYGEGYTSVQLKAFGVLLDQPDAPQIFRALLKHGDAAGQMFALCGLCLVDRPYFDAQVGRFCSDRRRLYYWYGCIPSPTTVAELVQRRGPVIHVPPGHELPDAFYADAGNRHLVDIIGGGWPEILRIAVSRMDDNGDIRYPGEGLVRTENGSLFGKPDDNDGPPTTAPDEPAPAAIEYQLEVPHHVPLVIEVPGEDGETVTELGREWYAAAHRDGWYECLDRFVEGELRLAEPMPTAWQPPGSKLAGEARVAGFRACFERLCGAATGDEESLRRRLGKPTWYERVGDYVDADTRRQRGEADEPERLPERPDPPTREWALELLLKTDEFTIRVGGSGTSIQLEAFKVIASQPDRVNALRELLQRGRVAGQLFALCALYFDDPETYQAAIARFRGDERPVEHRSGCIQERLVAHELVENHAPNTVRLGPGQTIDGWFEVNESGVLDIVGGGWPHVIRDMLNRMDQQEDHQPADNLLGR